MADISLDAINVADINIARHELSDRVRAVQSDVFEWLPGGPDGLDITRQILRHAADHLNVGGVLIVEVGNSCVALDEAYPNVPFMWLEFERGGHGVFVMTREQLLEYADSFA